MACPCGLPSADPRVVAESVSMALEQIERLPTLPEVALAVATRALRIASGTCIACVYECGPKEINPMFNAGEVR